MATHKSAEKRHRQSLKRRENNRSARAAIRTAIKNTVLAAGKGEREDAVELARQSTRLLDKAVKRGVLHKKNAQRRISRLQKRVAAL